MKHVLLSAFAGGALIVGSAYAQTPPPGSEAAEKQHYEQRQADQGRVSRP
jgi:hypothetical protein